MLAFWRVSRHALSRKSAAWFSRLVCWRTRAWSAPPANRFQLSTTPAVTSRFWSGMASKLWPPPARTRASTLGQNALSRSPTAARAARRFSIAALMAALLRSATSIACAAVVGRPTANDCGRGGLLHRRFADDAQIARHHVVQVGDVGGQVGLGQCHARRRLLDVDTAADAGAKTRVDLLVVEAMLDVVVFRQPTILR